MHQALWQSFSAVNRCLLGATHAEETSARLHPQLSTVNCQLSTVYLAPLFRSAALGLKALGFST